MGMGICFKLIIGDWCEAMFASFPFTHMESTTVGRAPKVPAPLLWRRPKAASFMDGGVGAGEAADAAKHTSIHANICKMCV